MPEKLGAVKAADGVCDERPNEDIRQERAPFHDPNTKVNRIQAACEGAHDFSLLVDLATSVDGLCDDESRRLACMYMQINQYSFAAYSM